MSHDENPVEGQGQSLDPQHTQPIPPVAPARVMPTEPPAQQPPLAAPGSHRAPAQAPQSPQAQHGAQAGGGAPASYSPTGSFGGAPQQGAHAAYGAPQQPYSGYQQQQGMYGAAPVHATTTAPRRKSRAPWVAVPIAAVLAAALAAGGTYALADDNNNGGTTATAGDTTVVQANPADFADAGTVNWAATASKVSPSVVSITVTGSGGDSDGESSSRGGAQGSGVILDKAGNIVTNNHVVAQGGTVRVTLQDNRTFEATVVGLDPSTDLGVIKIKSAPSDLKPVEIGDDSKLLVGQPVMAVGNPLGLSGTVTTGIVSALNRPVSTEQSGGDGGGDESVVTNAIQTSAAINPGNSGGALVNGSGKLIGINSSIATVGGSGLGSSQSGNIGIGFAIPVTVVKNITGQLLKSGKAQHPLLGVEALSGQANDGAATVTGAKVEDVTDGSAAQKAGIKVGDLIVKIDGEAVESQTSLIGQVRERTVGQKVTLTIVRDGKRQDVSATLGAQPAK